MYRGKPQAFSVLSFFLEQAACLADQPVCHLLRFLAEGGGLFKHIRHFLRLSQDAAVIFRQTIFALVTCHFFWLQFRQGGADRFQPLIADADRRKIRIREITVIFRILFRTHRIGVFLVVIPASRLLDDLPALFQQLNLAGALAVDRTGNRLERVQVLHLGSRTKCLTSHLTDR